MTLFPALARDVCRTVAVVLPLALVPGAPANAASFDCSKASAPDELKVCENRKLSELDTEMAALYYAYNAFPYAMGARGNMRDEADAFLAKRKACGADVPCLEQVYQDRVKVLKQDIQNSVKLFTRGEGP